MSLSLKARGRSRGGTQLLSEIDQARFNGDYAHALELSHSLPSSSVQYFEGLRGLIAGEEELERQIHSQTPDDSGCRIAIRYFEDVIAKKATHYAQDVLEARILLARATLAIGKKREALSILQSLALPNAKQLAPDVTERHVLFLAHALTVQASLSDDWLPIGARVYELMSQHFFTRTQMSVTATSKLVVVVSLLDRYCTATAAKGDFGCIESLRLALGQSTGAPSLPQLIWVQLAMTLAHILATTPPADYQPPKPRVSSTRGRGNEQSNPTTPDGEAILLLTLAEQRLLAMPNPTARRLSVVFTALYDRLYTLMQRNGLISDLVVVLERAVAYTHAVDNSQLWLKLGIALVQLEALKAATQVFDECLALSQATPTFLINVLQHAVPCVLRQSYKAQERAEAYLVQLKKFTYASVTATESDDSPSYLDIDSDEPVPDHPVCTGYFGLEALRWLCLFRQTEDEQKAQNALLTAEAFCSKMVPKYMSLDNWYTASLISTHGRNIPTAVLRVTSALGIEPFHAPSMKLLALLYSAQNQDDHALAVCSRLLEETPKDMTVIRLTAQLVHKKDGANAALSFYLEAIQQFSPDATPGTGRDSGLAPTAVYSHTRADSIYSLHSTNAQSILSVATSGVDTIVSSIAGMYGVGHQTEQTQLLLDAAHLYISLGEFKEADQCIEAAISVTDVNVEVAFAKAKLMQAREQDAPEVISQLELALACDERHLPTLVELSRYLFAAGNSDMAEHWLTAALNVDPMAPEPYELLATIHQQRNQHDVAADLIVRGLEVAGSTPQLPFTLCPAVL
eukprot:m.12350 g.12350  ORF g.12350 m.12350 type:complete len:799 (+) comp5820_c0_seq1:368-2764(+)